MSFEVGIIPIKVYFKFVYHVQYKHLNNYNLLLHMQQKVVMELDRTRIVSIWGDNRWVGNAGMAASEGLSHLP
jgi:hypothetical protein